jgi:hypothetical protein
VNASNESAGVRALGADADSVRFARDAAVTDVDVVVPGG